jgi:hypothetical protein
MGGAKGSKRAKEQTGNGSFCSTPLSLILVVDAINK